VTAVIDEVVDLVPVDGVVGALVRRQLIRRNGVQTTLNIGPVGQPALLGGGADVRQGAGLGVTARQLLLAPGPLLGGDVFELGVQSRRRSGGGRRVGRTSQGRRRGGGEGQQADGDCNGAIGGQGLHRLSPKKQKQTPCQRLQGEKPPETGRLPILD